MKQKNSFRSLDELLESEEEIRELLQNDDPLDGIYGMYCGDDNRPPR